MLLNKMRMKTFAFACLAGLFGGVPLLAQAQYTSPVQVETSNFGDDTFAIGSLSANEGALPSDLWAGASAANVGFLLEQLRSDYANPVSIDILRRTLLTPGDGPAGADGRLAAQKLMALARVGFYEEAASLAELATSGNQPELSQPVAYGDMMRGDMTSACRRGANLQSGRNSEFWLKLRLLCYASNGEQSAADLTYGLLKDQGLLKGQEGELFTAVAIGAKPRGTIVPKTGFEYAAVRQLELPLPLDRLDEVNGAVLRALAGEEKAPQQARILAAERAYFLGVLSSRRLREIFQSIAFEPDRLAGAADILSQRPDNYLVDALVYQSVKGMTSGEASLDRAALVGESLRRAKSYQRFHALAAAYAPVAQDFEVVVNYAPYAREFALAGVLAGESVLADRWISVLATNQAEPKDQEYARQLLSLLAFKDEAQARAIADYAGLDFVTPSVSALRLPSLSDSARQGLVADLVRIMLETVQSGAKGQAALLVLAAQGVSPVGELGEIAAVVRQQALGIAGLEGVGRDLAFRQAAKNIVNADGAPIVTGANRTLGEGASYQPRIKPTRNG